MKAPAAAPVVLHLAMPGAARVVQLQAPQPPECPGWVVTSPTSTLTCCSKTARHQAQPTLERPQSTQAPEAVPPSTTRTLLHLLLLAVRGLVEVPVRQRVSTLSVVRVALVAAVVLASMCQPLSLPRAAPAVSEVVAVVA